MKTHPAQYQVVETSAVHVSSDTRPSVTAHRNLGQITFPGSEAVKPVNAVCIHGMWYARVQDLKEAAKLQAAFDYPVRAVPAVPAGAEVNDATFDNARALELPQFDLQPGDARVIQAAKDIAGVAVPPVPEVPENTCKCGHCLYCLASQLGLTPHASSMGDIFTAVKALQDRLKCIETAAEQEHMCGFGRLIKLLRIHRDVLQLVPLDKPDDGRVYLFPRATALLLDMQHPAGLFEKPYEGVKIDHQWFVPASAEDANRLEQTHVTEPPKREVVDIHDFSAKGEVFTVRPPAVMLQEMAPASAAPVETKPQGCCYFECAAPATVEIADTNEPRADVALTYACDKHIADMLSSVSPTLPKGPWSVKPLRGAPRVMVVAP